jgi:hypothetical protein
VQRKSIRFRFLANQVERIESQGFKVFCGTHTDIRKKEEKSLQNSFETSAKQTQTNLNC